MESSLNDLYDEYPVGWVLTYRCRWAPGPPSGNCSAGVVLGSPVRDPRTGLETIPLAPLDGGRGAPTVLVPDRDIIGIEPRQFPTGRASDDVGPQEMMERNHPSG